MGAKFGTLVHAVLETADPFAADLAAELESQIRLHSVWWPVDVTPEVLAAAMVPMHDTPLGPLADGLTLRQIGLRDRLRELDFEFPLAGGDLGSAAAESHLADVGRLLREHLPADDVMAPYADRLTGQVLGSQSLRGYLTGSIDAVLRVPDGAGHRYLVVDYKTNWLGDPERALTPPITTVHGWSRRCCTRTIRCRRCCTALCCTASCGGGCRTTIPPGISAGSSICSCAACAARTRRWSMGTRRECSAGSRHRL